MHLYKVSNERPSVEYQIPEFIWICVNTATAEFQLELFLSVVMEQKAVHQAWKKQKQINFSRPAEEQTCQILDLILRWKYAVLDIALKWLL